MTLLNLGERLHMDTDHADIIFVVDKENIPGHRLVLANTCDYFEKLLFGDFRESKSNRIEISGTSTKVFREVMRFVYLGRLEVTDWKLEDLLALLSLAHEYQFNQLFSQVVKDLEERQLDIDSWTLVNTVAVIYKSKELKRKCASFAETKFDEFVGRKNLATFTPEFVSSIFESSQISSCNQDQLLGSLLKWTKNNKSDKNLLLFRKICWKNVSHDILAPIAEEYFSNLSIFDECKFEEKLLEMVKINSGGIFRIGNVALKRNESLIFPLDKYQCSLIFCLVEDRIAFRFKKNDSWSQVPVKRLDFKSSIYFNLYRAYGLTIEWYETEMALTEPMQDEECFKYSAEFCGSTQVISFAVYSKKFLNMNIIRLQNVVIC